MFVYIKAIRFDFNTVKDKKESLNTPNGREG